MLFQDHFKACPYCNKGLSSAKPTIRVKSASSCEKRRKLAELGNMIKGIKTSVKSGSFVENNTRTRGQGPIEKAIKLKKLGEMIRA